MAEEKREKRAYVRRAPLNTPEINRQRRAEFAASQPPPIDRASAGPSTPTRRSVSISDIRTEDELREESARNTANSDLVSSYEAGTLRETHPYHATVRIADVPSQRVSESDVNYNKRLGKSPHGAVWARALALPGTIVSHHGIHFDQREFHKHWGVPAREVHTAVTRNPSVGVPPVSNEDFQRVSSQAEGNSWEDTDGTATGAAD